MFSNDPTTATQFNTSSLLGAALPTVELLDTRGEASSLSELTQGHPSLIIIARTTDCLSCANFAFEIRILRERFRKLRILLVGSGPGDSTFSEYFRKERIAEHGVRDENRSLITALGVPHEPIVLLADSTGMIVFADSRSNSASAQFPIGQILPLLATSLASYNATPPENTQ